MNQIKKLLSYKISMIIFIFTSLVLFALFLIMCRLWKNTEPSKDIKGFYQARTEINDFYSANFDGENYEIYYFKDKDDSTYKLVLTSGTYEKCKDNVYLLKDGEKRFMITLLHNKFYLQIPKDEEPMNQNMDTVLEFRTIGDRIPTTINVNGMKVKKL